MPAGNVLAIGGLDTAILKSATLADTPAARPLAPMLFQVASVHRAVDIAPGPWSQRSCLSALQHTALKHVLVPGGSNWRYFTRPDVFVSPDDDAPAVCQAAPIVRVAVEAKAPGDMAALRAGLDLLNRADPLAEVTVQSSGEHVLGAAGESTENEP